MRTRRWAALIGLAAVWLPAASCATDMRYALRDGVMQFLTANTVAVLDALIPVDETLTGGGG
jgi:hypothetical protein